MDAGTSVSLHDTHGLVSAFGDNQLHHGSPAQVTCIVAGKDHLQATQDLA